MPVSVNNAKNYALKLLSIRGRSENEIRDRLKRKGVEDETINSILSTFRGKGFIDDYTLAKQYINYAFKSKKLGINGIKTFLFSRGIPEGIIESLELDSIDELEGAEQLIRKKMNIIKDLSKEKTKRRISGMLQRRGYSYETISKIMRKIF